MTLRDLIDQLTDLADEHGDDVEMRLAQQPRWAFEYAIDSVAAADPSDPDNHDEEDDDDESDKPVVVYIAEGRQLGYLPGVASRALGWRS